MKNIEVKNAIKTEIKKLTIQKIELELQIQALRKQLTVKNKNEQQ